MTNVGFPCGSAGKESTCNVGDLGLIPGLGISPGEGKGYPLQYSGLVNSMDYIVHGVPKSRTQLSDFHSLTHSMTNVYLSFSPLPLTLLLFSAFCKASSDNHFAFLHFFFLGMLPIIIFGNFHIVFINGISIILASQVLN